VGRCARARAYIADDQKAARSCLLKLLTKLEIKGKNDGK
jgi:hypothetical protein